MQNIAEPDAKHSWLRTIASFPARGRWSVFAKAFAKALTRALQEWPHRSALVRAYTPFHVRQQLLAHPAREPVRPQSRRVLLFDLPVLRAHEACILSEARSILLMHALSSFFTSRDCAVGFTHAFGRVIPNVQQHVVGGIVGTCVSHRALPFLGSYRRAMGHVRDDQCAPLTF